MSRLKYLITMTTVDREPRENYLPQTLKSMERAGIFKSEIPHEVHLFDSGSKDLSYVPEGYPLEIHLPPDEFRNMPLKPTKKHAVYPKHRVSLRLNMAALCRYAIATDARYVIMLEDDIIFCSRFLESVDKWMSLYFNPEEDLVVPAVSFFTPRRPILKAYNAGQNYWLYPVEKFYARQCTLVHCSLLSIIESWMLSHYNGEVAAHDLEFGKALASAYPKRSSLYASAPCFVQHVGMQSAILHKDKQVISPLSFSFQGEDWSFV